MESAARINEKTQEINAREYAKELLLFADTQKKGGHQAYQRCQWILGRLVADDARKAILREVERELGL